MRSVFRSIAPGHVRASHLLSTTALAAVVIASYSSVALAQAGSTSLDLPTIVVSPTTVPTPVEQTGSSVTVITASDIQREQRRTVPDILATVPGLNVVQTGPGAATAVYMRGTNSAHTKVLIDGIDVSDPSNEGRAFDFSQLLASDIERIEVLRGPQSGLYGSNAMGGVISITTKKGEGPAKVTATMEGGSFGTFNQSAGVSGSEDRFNYAFNVQHFRSTDTPSVPLRELPPGQTRKDDFFDNKTVSSRLGYEVSDTLSFNWVGRYTDTKYRNTDDDFFLYNPVTFAGYPNPTQSTQTAHQLYTRGEAVVKLFDGRFQNFFGASYSEQHRDYNDPYGWMGYVLSAYQGTREKYDWRGVLDLLPGQKLVMGLDTETERYAAYGFGSSNRAENSNRGGYVELQSEIAKRLFIVANARYDDNDAFGGHSTYRISPAYLVPGTETKLKASYGTGFKAPSLYQLYDPNYGNSSLKPEESVGWDAGFEQPLFNDRARFGATYFHNDISNLLNIVYDASSHSFYRYANVDQAQTRGVETFAMAKLTDQIKVRADYTYTEAVDASTGLELLRRPKHKASVTTTWTPLEPLSLSLTVLHVDSWYDSSDRNNYVGYQKVDGYTVVNLAADYKVNQTTTVFGRIDNLFNEHYEVPLGFLRPGIGVFGGVRWTSR